MNLFFALLSLACALMPWGLAGLGIALPKRLALIMTVAGALCFVAAISVPIWEWFAPSTYVYLMPGRGLAENSALSPKDMIPYRLFVVKEGGTPRVLNNVTVTLRDNHDESQAKDASINEGIN
jgi:hypothetical protein